MKEKDYSKRYIWRGAASKHHKFYIQKECPKCKSSENVHCKIELDVCLIHKERFDLVNEYYGIRADLSCGYNKILHISNPSHTMKNAYDKWWSKNR